MPEDRDRCAEKSCWGGFSGTSGGRSTFRGRTARSVVAGSGAAGLPVAADRRLPAGEPAFFERKRRMRCTAAASPAAQTRGRSRSPRRAPPQRARRRARRPREGRATRQKHAVVGEGEPASGSAISISTLTVAARGRCSRSWLIVGMAVSSPARRDAVVCSSIVYPRPGPDTAAPTPGAAVRAHCDAAPSPCTTASMTSSSVSVRPGGE